MTKTVIVSVLLVTWILPFTVLLTGAAIQPVIKKTCLEKLDINSLSQCNAYTLY